MSFSGYDIEDALVLNRASLDRGNTVSCLFVDRKTVIDDEVKTQKLISVIAHF